MQVQASYMEIPHEEEIDVWPSQLRRHVTEEAILDIPAPTDTTWHQDQLFPIRPTQVVES